ncbi:MAG TPA: hypothetical protein VF574_10770 [Allosphingosinicella sp.]|jgi:hypothetical protein
MANVRIVQPGAAKPRGVWPYTVCIVANPWIESARNSNQFVADPIVNNESAFEEKVRYILDLLGGRLPGQAEQMFAPLSPLWRIITIFDPGRERKGRNALVYHDNTNMVVPRQKVFAAFLKTFRLPGFGKLRADVMFAVSASATHVRSSALATLDDDDVPGRPFTVDGARMVHRPQNKFPGAVALHFRAGGMVALHEFSHAASSWTNGLIGDLYDDEGEALNKRRGRPIPAAFCTYDGRSFAAAPTRGGGLPYHPGSDLFHCEQADPAFPALMDNYLEAAGGRAERCRHDRLTRQFLLDRIQTIMAR